MPKQTFFNLPDEKRELIIDVALDEFADNDFDAASISRIVSRAGIAKGSFYQYFEDKEDLYAYLLSLIVQKKAEAFSLDHPDPEHIGLFNYIRWMFAGSVEFEAANPRFSRLGYRMFHGGSNENRIFEQTVENANTYYRGLVAIGKKQGDIAPDIDDAMAASVLRVMFTEIGREIVRAIIDTHGSAWHGKKPLFDFPEARSKYDQMLRILEFGLGGHAPPDSTAEASTPERPQAATEGT